MIKRRQLLAKIATVAGSVIVLPALVGESIAKAATRRTSTNDKACKRIKLKKGHSVFYVNPRTATREQLSAVVETLEVEVPYSSTNTLPHQTDSRCVPTMKMS